MKKQRDNMPFVRVKKVSMTFLLILLLSCENKSRYSDKGSVEVITDPGRQDTIFSSLVHLTNNAIPEDIRDDSLAFLVLPVQVSCPSCRTKAIDSIIKYKNSLTVRHFIVISAKGGRKKMSSYFREQGNELPEIKGNLFLDSTDQAFEFGLYDKKPTIYYTFNRKARKKVSAIPSTVREDLHEFFSGQRKKSSK